MAGEYIEDQLDRIEGKLDPDRLDRIEGKLDQLLARDDDRPPPVPPVPAQHPTDLIPALRTWTIMRPTGKQDSPDNGYLIGQSVTGIYYVDGGAVVFRCPPDGTHSSGSKYPRTEAREMADEKGTKAAWSSAGPRTLVAEMAIDTSHLATRKRISGVQIHDAKDDVLQLLVDERGRLGIAHNDGDAFEVLDEGYRGEWFTLQIYVADDRVRVAYNSTAYKVLPKRGTGWYYKIGCYLQTGGASEYVEPAGAYGEVRLRRLAVES